MEDVYIFQRFVFRSVKDCSMEFQSKGVRRVLCVQSRFAASSWREDLCNAINPHHLVFMANLKTLLAQSILWLMVQKEVFNLC